VIYSLIFQLLTKKEYSLYIHMFKTQCVAVLLYNTPSLHNITLFILFCL
jgi:hypothetical protein